MKILIASLILGASFPVNAHESIGDHIHREAYESQKDMHMRTSASAMNTGKNIFQALQFPRVMSNLIVKRFLSHAIVIAKYLTIIIIRLNHKLRM